MKNYKIIIQYEGTRFQGWQRQTSTDNTIQGKIEAILSKMCGVPVEINGAGRTDAGVHSKGQVANFKIHTDKSAGEIMDYLNLYLPEDVAVVAIEEADERFHARLKAKGKYYQYRLRTLMTPDVFSRRYTCSYAELPNIGAADTMKAQEFNVPNQTVRLDVNAMRKAAQMLSGKHDFKAFTSNHRTKKSTVRTIDIQIKETPEEIVFDYTGDGFLYHMVRILTGTLIEVGEGKRTPQSMTDILNSEERANAGILVPAKGLTLVEVYYK
ncbi:MAG: tRNA pseudouridine(38-40) synthase TruA [Lachnospiraceae bacterium]|nr:tRNA pseudouridine(38-40) synthase TruA [Lachnospiraceae bacterium]